MIATECDICDEIWAYDRARCPACGGESFSTIDLGTGELVAKTVARVTPPGVREPNRLGIARFGDVSVTAQLADEELAVGDAVVLAGDHALREGQRGRRIEPI